jgi:hypothetical protein
MTEDEEEFANRLFLEKRRKELRKLFALDTARYEMELEGKVGICANNSGTFLLC